MLVAALSVVVTGLNRMKRGESLSRRVGFVRVQASKPFLANPEGGRCVEELCAQ